MSFILKLTTKKKKKSKASEGARAAVILHKNIGRSGAFFVHISQIEKTFQKVLDFSFTSDYNIGVR